MNTPVLKLRSYPEPVEMALRGMDKLLQASAYLRKEIHVDFTARRSDELEAYIDAIQLLLMLNSEIRKGLRERGL